MVVQGERFADLLASLSRMTEGTWQPEPAAAPLAALKTLPPAPAKAVRSGADGATALPRPPRAKAAAKPRPRPAPVRPPEG